MMEIIFVACLSAEPTACDSKALQFADLSMIACVMSAQPVLAQWVVEHPGWEIQRWSCRIEGSDRNT